MNFDFDCKRFIKYLRPPCGTEVRRFVAGLTLAVGVPRLPYLDDVLIFAPLRYASPEVYGVYMTLIGLALLGTAFHWRLDVPGRLAAALGVAGWAMLAAATDSVTSILFNIGVVIVLLAEVWAQKGGCQNGIGHG